MRALELNGFDGVDSLTLVEAARPEPSPTEILIDVKAAGMNYAELELIRGKYPPGRPLPYVFGFEASGIVAAVGSGVRNFAVGDRVAAAVSSGGYASYATADSNFAFAIPDGVTFAEAASITVQGLTAYSLLKLAARPQAHESILIQAAAGGVGIFLVQLAKLLGAKQVIALAGSDSKLELVRELGADVAINYTEAGWAESVLRATGGRGVDIVLEAVSGTVGNGAFDCWQSSAV